MLKVCLRQRKEKKRLKNEIKKLKLKLKQSKSEAETLKATLDESNKCKESLQSLCKSSMDRLNESNTRLAEVLVELDNKKSECINFFQTIKTQLEKIKVEYDSSKIVSTLLKLFTIDKKENLLEGLGKVLKVMLTLPKLQDFINEIYRMLNLSKENPKPEKVLNELREVITEAKAHRQIQNELNHILNTKITNNELIIREIRRKLTEVPQYQHVISPYIHRSAVNTCVYTISKI